MTKLSCDKCEADLSDSKGRPSYYLTLSCLKMNNKSQFEYSLWVKRPFNDDLHFCGTKCLKEFLDVPPKS